MPKSADCPIRGARRAALSVGATAVGVTAFILDSDFKRYPAATEQLWPIYPTVANNQHMIILEISLADIERFQARAERIAVNPQTIRRLGTVPASQAQSFDNQRLFNPGQRRRISGVALCIVRVFIQ